MNITARIQNHPMATATVSPYKLSPSRVFDKIALPTNDGKIYIRPEEIAYIKSDNIYCYLHFTNGNSRFIPKQMKWVQAHLDAPNFIRIHRSYLINVNSIAEYRREECGYFVMENGEVVPISRSKRSRVEDIITL